MTAELTALALAAILQMLQIGITGYVLNREVDPKWLAGPRDTEVSFSPMGGRLRRAVNNHFEGLILFTAAVLVITVSGERGSFTAICAWVYLLARVAYFPAYAFGWTPWRSIIWAVGLLATIALLLSALF